MSFSASFVSEREREGEIQDTNCHEMNQIPDPVLPETKITLFDNNIVNSKPQLFNNLKILPY